MYKVIERRLNRLTDRGTTAFFKVSKVGSHTEAHIDLTCQ